MNNPPKRPKSITVISWICLVFSMLFLLVLLIPYGPESAKSREEFRIKDPVNYYHFHVTLFILVVAAIGMLRGNNMARWLFVAWLAYRVYCNIGMPVQLTLMVAVMVVVCFYMFRPQAAAFFMAKRIPTSSIP